MSNGAVMATLEDYARAYCAKDIDALMAVFSDSDEISAIGTGADELCAGRDRVRELFLRNFSEAQAYRFEWHWRHMIITEYQAIVAITLTIHLEVDGNRVEVPVRWTVVMRRESDRWVWLHRHASSAASDQAEGQAYPQGNA